MKAVGGPAAVPASSSGSMEEGLIAHLGLVLAEAAAMSYPHRSTFPSPTLMPSPRLLLSSSPLAPAPVVRSPPPVPVWSCSSSSGPLANAESAPHVGGSPTPSRSLMLATEADDEAEAEANDVAELKADDEADILAEAESDGSPGYVTTDSEDDRLHRYATPVLSGPNLFWHVSLYGGMVCPICSNRKARGWSKADARAHVLARAHTPLDGTYTNDKNVARHCALARN